MTIRKTQKGMQINTPRAELLLREGQIKVERKAEDEDPRGNQFTVPGPGEYEIEGVSVQAERFDPDDTASPLLYLIDAENFTVAYLPLAIPTESTQQTLPETIASIFDNIDILLISGHYTQIINQLAASLVIPIDEVETLATKLQVDLPEKRTSFTIKKHSDLPEEMEIVNLG